VGALGADYLRYNRPTRRHPMRDGKFMLVLPQLPEPTNLFRLNQNIPPTG
jgi:hypothetical protein